MDGGTLGGGQVADPGVPPELEGAPPAQGGGVRRGGGASGQLPATEGEVRLSKLPMDATSD